MRAGRYIGWALSTVALFGATAVQAGTIDGRIEKESGSGLSGVTVVVTETGQVRVTDRDGSFRFNDVAEGSYTLSFTLGDRATTEAVEVSSDGVAQVEKMVDWDVSFAESITVYSASRRRERIVEAPAAVTSIPEEEIEREGAHGQIPKLLEFTPGVATTQSGLYDFNMNARGFNSSLNRRVVVLVDGRDPSVPFLGSQEWIVVSPYMNDLGSAEMVRGPSSALYGANAFNGVLNLVTKSPRTHPGGEARVTGGELDTIKADFRIASAIGGGWHFKLSGAYLDSDDFSVDRTVAAGGPEYSGLAPEAVGRPVTTNEMLFGNIRLDREMSNGDFLAFEGGYAEGQQPVIQTGIGRVSIPDVNRAWGRLNYTATHWNFLGYFNQREGNDQLGLQSGAPNFLDSENYHLEVQTNWDFADGKVRLVAGVTYEEEEIDTANRAGRQTLTFGPVDSDSQALYAQLDFDATDDLKFVIAGRYDESSLHDSQVSPKAAVVYSFNQNHSLRASYNEAFQVANYSEFYLQGDVAAPITALGAPNPAFGGLSFEQALCGQFGISCGLEFVRVLALGNESLEVEEVQSWELGYSGILGTKAFLTIDYYKNELDNFITDLLPNVGTALGRLNSDFGPYQAPANHPAPATLLGALQQALGANFFALSNNFDGSPILAAVSYTNFGQVDTQGVDVGFNMFATDNWRVNANYSWFDFDIKEELPGDPLVPNAPEHSMSAGVQYLASRWDLGVSWRWVDDFQWVVGTIFNGTVPSYDVLDVTANYRVTDNVEVGLNVSNVTDDEHFESFGGDLIGRRALGHVLFRW